MLTAAQAVCRLERLNGDYILSDFIFDGAWFSIFRNNIFYNGKKYKTYIEYIDIFADDMVYYVIY